MSLAVFPIFPGLTWSTFKSSNWGTKYQRAISGKTLRQSDYINPVWDFQLVYDVLHDKPFGAYTVATALRTMMDFWNSRGGGCDPFLYDDPYDDAAIGQTFGISDGVTTVWGLTRRLVPGGFPERVWAINLSQTFNFYINGVAQVSSNYSVDPSTGIITLIGPAASGAVLSADFSFYFVVRFATDGMDFEQFMHQFWSLRSVKFRSIINPPPAIVPYPLVIVTPQNPTIPDTTTLGSTVGTITILMSDNSTYQGPAPVFVAPNFDDGGRFVITGATSGPGPYDLVLNTAGPGLPFSSSIEFITVSVPPS